MTNEQVWTERVRAWRASGKSKAYFSRGKEFTASALGYWVKRLGGATASPAEAPVRLARVVRTRQTSERVRTSSSDRAPSGSESSIVVEVMALRVVVPGDLVASQLDAVVAAVTRGWGGGRA